MINSVLIITLVAIVAILFLKTKYQGIVTVVTVILIASLSSFFSVLSLSGNSYEIILTGTTLFGPVPVKIDSLTGWFILLINFTLITGSVYGLSYMKIYREKKSEMTLHCIAFILVQFTLLGICSVQNGFVFLLLWEIMALSVFVLVIFDHERPDTIKAGINYIVQSHISIVFIMLGFIYVAYKSGSYDFDAVSVFSKQQSTLEGTALFLCFFIGFAIKAGFVPFHTWLPYAHPAAPSHVSGIMSGVIIKVGIYGILRMLLLIKTDYTTIGYIILVISTITGVYGVMLATIQHNLKKLLAYHSIENIGIIGMGIGLGCIGLGATNKWMAILGFSGALLHTLNHSLFKSLLFFTAGNIYKEAGTVNIEHLGGLIKRMPQTAFLFLIAAVSICGLPPLNGFISEFLIFGGLYNWLYSASLISLIVLIFSLTGLAVIGGLAIFCFTKAFSIVFLGSPRKRHPEYINEGKFWQLLPMYLTVAMMFSIGFFPSFFINTLQRPVNLFTHHVVFNLNLISVGAIDSLMTINWLAVIFIVLIAVITILRNWSVSKKIIETGPTWKCGYCQPDSRMQYTSNSFARSYMKIAKPLLDIEKTDVGIKEVFPGEKNFKTDPYDKLERTLIDKPLDMFNKTTDMFLFLQNGHLQRYILYGILFIAGVICLPLIFDKILTIIKFLNNL